MSNLIQNGDFQTPLLESGIYLQQEASDYVWIGTNKTYLNNGIGYFGYPTPPTGVSSQYLNFQFKSLLYQNINVSTKGKYALTLYHCRRPILEIGAGLDILLDDVLVTTIPGDIPKTWASFRIEFATSRTGNQKLKFMQPIDTINELAITNVSLVGLELLTDSGAIYLPPLNFNQGKVFNIEDYEYQDKPVSLRTGDERYLKSNSDINHNGSLYVDGDLTSRTFSNQPSSYFTNTTSNIQEQINGLITKKSWWGLLVYYRRGDC